MVLVELPPYQVAHEVHEEEIRKRHAPLAYDGYMIGVNAPRLAGRRGATLL